jgi:hypothetical protein
MNWWNDFGRENKYQTNGFLAHTLCLSSSLLSPCRAPFTLGSDVSQILFPRHLRHQTTTHTSQEQQVMCIYPYKADLCYTATDVSESKKYSIHSRMAN